MPRIFRIPLADPKKSVKIISNFKPREVRARRWPRGAVIFFHGAVVRWQPPVYCVLVMQDGKMVPCGFLRGDTGQGLRENIHHLLKRHLQFNYIKMIYPTAPLMPYTPRNGNLTPVWFDQLKISPNIVEDVQTIDTVCQNLKHLIDREVSLGIPRDRIILGGFSMGGALALHLAYRFCPDVAGVFSLSSFLNDDSAVYSAVEEAQNKRQPVPPLFCAHLRRDPLIPFAWGTKTFDMLARYGVNVSTYFDNSYHELKKVELLKLELFISNTLKNKFNS